MFKKIFLFLIISYPIFAKAQFATGIPAGKKQIQSLIYTNGDSLSLYDGSKAFKVSSLGYVDLKKSKTTTVAGLRSMISPQSDIIYQTYDYGGGQWRYISNTAIQDNVSDNTGTIVVNAATGGYFKRIYSGDVNAAWFGVVGDGVTDDTKALNAAMLFINGKIGRGILRLPTTAANRIYIDSLNLLSYVSIKGDGRTQIVARKSNATGLLKMHDSPLRDVEYSGFALVGDSTDNPNQHGFDFTATDTLAGFGTGGFWYSTVHDIQITGFSGHGLHMVSIDRDASHDVANQFLTFTNVRIFAGKRSTSRALYSLGQLGQVTFLNCQFDCENSTVNSGVTAIELTSQPGLNGTDNVYATHFISPTIQTCDLGAKIYYAKVYFDQVHFEQINKGIYARGVSQVSITNSELYSPATNSTNYYVVRNEGSSVTLNGNILGGGFLVGSSQSGYNLTGNNFQTNSTSVTTTGYVVQASISSGSLANIYANKHILLNLNNGTLSTITSQLLPGDDLILRGFDSGTSNYFTTINTSGNILLPGTNGQLVLRAGDEATFTRSDLAGNVWTLKSLNKAEMRGTAIPTTGAWVAGEKIYNSSYSFGQPVYWICRTSSVITSGVPASVGTWEAVYTNNYGSTYQTSIGADGSLVVNTLSDILLNTGSTALKTITSTLPVGSVIRMRVWENGTIGSFISVNNSGNIILPNGATTIYARANEVLTFVQQNLAGTWVLQSDSYPGKSLASIPVNGPWNLGEIVYFKNPSANGNIGVVVTTAGEANQGNWSANSPYVFNNEVLSNGNVYKVTVGGTSSTTAPNGTGTFTDGTVTWVYVGPPVVFSPFGKINSDNAYASSTSAIQNQNSTTQTANYKISGTGQAQNFIIGANSSLTRQTLLMNDGSTGAIANASNVFYNGTGVLTYVTPTTLNNNDLVYKGYTDATYSQIPNNFRNNAATFTLPLTNLTNYGTFYGTTATWTLGAVAAGSNVTYYIKNAGSGVLTINSAAGGNDIYYTAAVATISISAGNAIIIHNDGVNWQVE